MKTLGLKTLVVGGTTGTGTWGLRLDSKSYLLGSDGLIVSKRTIDGPRRSVAVIVIDGHRRSEVDVDARSDFVVDELLLRVEGGVEHHKLVGANFAGLVAAASGALQHDGLHGVGFDERLERVRELGDDRVEMLISMDLLGLHLVLHRLPLHLRL